LQGSLRRTIYFSLLFLTKPRRTKKSVAPLSSVFLL